MATVCPQCGHDIPPDDVNVAANVAYCRACDKPFPLSAMIDAAAMSFAASPSEVPAEPAPETPPPADLAHPPIGCWYTDDGRNAEVGASIRGDGNAAPIIFAALFWNGITWLFVIIMISEMIGGHFDDWFVLLFLLPFVAIGLGFAWFAALCVFGKAIVRIGAEQGEAFIGIAGVGWRKRFRPSDATGVTIGNSGTRVNGRQRRQITLHFLGDTLSFGTLVNDDRLRFIAGAMIDMLGLRRG